MKNPKPDIPFSDRDACTIPEFCVSIGICRSSYYNMPPEDRPTEIQVNGSKRITRESRQEWRRRKDREASDATAS